MRPAVVDIRPKQHARRSVEISPFHRVDDDAHLGQYIPLHYHGQMLANEQRMGPFHEAIDKLVPVGSYVVELGGGTGVMSFLASRRARKVTMVERVPHVAATARLLLARNGVADKVSVVEADARAYVPDEPVDVVICEMLHTALLREKQIEARFGRRVPRIIPEASLLGVQLIYQPYEFHGYYAPVPFFFEPGTGAGSTIEMSPPALYSLIEYVDDLPETFPVDALLTVDKPGTVNALRFSTRNAVGVFVAEKRTADWYMPNMSLALPHPIPVNAGDRLRVRFQYDAGGSIESLQSSLQASIEA
jgi:predicted RNA methylase